MSQSGRSEAPRENLEAYKGEYLNPTPDRQVDQKMVRLVADFVIRRLHGERLLELGVGDQVWTPKLVRRFAEVTSVDGCLDLLQAMRSRLGPTVGNWSAVHSWFEEFEPQKRFDVVLCTYVLEHVDDPALIVRLARNRWLKHGGQLAVVVPHGLSLHRRLAVHMGLSRHPAEVGATDRRMGHKHCFTADELGQVIVDAGFKIIESRGMFTKALPNQLLTHCSDAQLEGLFNLGCELPIEYSAILFFLAQTR